METGLIDLPNYSIDYKPTPITINNYEGLQAAVKQLVSRYNDLVVTKDNVKDTKQVRADLKKLIKALDERRKEIKLHYNQPLNDFEKQIKDLEAQVDDVIVPIDVGLNELETQRKDKRRAKVEALIAEMASNYEIEPSEIEFDERWLNKTATEKQIVLEIGSAMKSVQQAHDKLANDIELVEKYAQVTQVDPEPYIDQLKQGSEIKYLTDRMDYQVGQRNQKQRAQESAARVEAQHQTVLDSGQTVDNETGEVVSSTFTLKITGTDANLRLLRHFMDEHQLQYTKVDA